MRFSSEAKKAIDMFGPPAQLQLELDRRLDASRQARRQLADLDATADAGPRFDDVLLIVSELVSNAVMHTSGSIVVSAWRTTNGNWRVEVNDESDDIPTLRADTSEQSIGGRGLRIVDHLADRWGVNIEPFGKCCWFELQT